jgi:RimJ/RimL family protein N-acetyltransferase
MRGRYCTVERLNPAKHGRELFNADSLEPSDVSWTYLSYGPFSSEESYLSWLQSQSEKADPLFFSILEPISGRAIGLASYLRIEPSHGSIEVGHLKFSPVMQRTCAATEAMYLMMARAFEGGYRRYEWKCDALNAGSRAAAQRLGFSYEGTFRQATVYKGRNRDTAWFSVIDKDWPAVKGALEQWLSPTNFDGHGGQKVALSSLTAPLLRPPQ